MDVVSPDCRTATPAESDLGAPHAGRAAPRGAITDPAALCRRLRLDPALASIDAHRAFPLLVPEPLVARIGPGDPNDPILRQVLPTAEELQPTPGFSVDPLAEAQSTATPGLHQQYAGRSLIITTGRCGVHCRYCFRRHRLGLAEAPNLEGRSDRIPPTVREIILSGGDPLTLDDDELATIVDRLAAIDHLRRLRVHARMPVAVPARVTERLCRILRDSRLTAVIVVQANHPAELAADAADAVARLIDAGIPVLCQSVLLRGVNDSADALRGLYERLIDLRVMPYYLHQLDRVAGAAHFEVPPAEGRRLLADLRRHLPGYAIPRYVRQQPGAASKVPLECTSLNHDHRVPSPAGRELG